MALTDIVCGRLRYFTKVDGAPGKDVARRALKSIEHYTKRVKHDDPFAGVRLKLTTSLP